MALPKTLLLDPQRAADHLSSRGIDALIGTGYVNYGYIAGYFTHFGRDYAGPLYNGLPLVRFAGLPADSGIPPFLVTYPGEEGDILAQGSWIEDRRYAGPRYNVPDRDSPLRVGDDPVRMLAEALDERGLASGTIGLDLSDISASLLEQVSTALPYAKLVDAGVDLRTLRMIKTPEEIDRLRGAVAGAERGHMAVREHLREDMTGLELAALVKRAVIDQSTDRYIVHVNAGQLGSVMLAPTDVPLRKDQLVSVDVGSICKPESTEGMTLQRQNG